MHEVVPGVGRGVFDTFGGVCAEIDLIAQVLLHARNASVSVAHYGVSTMVAGNASATSKRSHLA